MSGLTQAQKKILGKNYSKDVYHRSFCHLHSSPNEDSYYEDEDEQTFDEFLDMGRRPPNEEGTGRFKISATRNRIACLFFINPKLEKKNKNLRKRRDEIKKYLEIFFVLPVDILEMNEDVLDFAKETIHVGEYIYELTILPKKNKKNNKKRKKDAINDKTDNNRYIEVFSLFDALESLVTEPYLTMVAFIDHPLCELDEDSDTGYQVVCGRACGDRIACVSLPECSSSFKNLLCVASHELLHTIGFDHCNSWQCLMNASGSDNWLFLSPVNLRKLKIFHGIADEEEDGGKFVLSRYEKLLTLWNHSGVEGEQDENNLFEPEVQWLEEKIPILKNLLKNTEIIEIE
jgi:hypothetical protein